jgi:hypothetical protein
MVVDSEHLSKEDVDARNIRAFTPVFDGLCPGMTELVAIRP